MIAGPGLSDFASVRPAFACLPNAWPECVESLHNLASAIGAASGVLTNLKPTRTALPAEQRQKRIVLIRSLLPV